MVNYVLNVQRIHSLGLCSAAQSCPALCQPVECGSPGASVLGILQARILEWVAIPPPGDLLKRGTELVGTFYVSCSRWVLYRYRHLGAQSLSL